MAISSTTVALFSIGSSAVVATAGILVPLWVHISDRRSEARLRLAGKREITYLKLSELLFTIRMHKHSEGEKIAENMVGEMTIWASEKVRELFLGWLELFQVSSDPKKNPESEKQVRDAGEELRKQMTVEIQVIKPKRGI